MSAEIKKGLTAAATVGRTEILLRCASISLEFLQRLPPIASKENSLKLKELCQKLICVNNFLASRQEHPPRELGDAIAAISNIISWLELKQDITVIKEISEQMRRLRIYLATCNETFLDYANVRRKWGSGLEK